MWKAKRLIRVALQANLPVLVLVVLIKVRRDHVEVERLARRDATGSNFRRKYRIGLTARPNLKAWKSCPLLPARPCAFCWKTRPLYGKGTRPQKTHDTSYYHTPKSVRVSTNDLFNGIDCVCPSSHDVPLLFAQDQPLLILWERNGTENHRMG